MYRQTSKYRQQRRRGPIGGRTPRDPRDEPCSLPELRMRIVVERYDFGLERHELELRRTRRIDSYDVFVDGKFWRRCGLSATLAGLRKACPRVLSARALD